MMNIIPLNNAEKQAYGKEAHVKKDCCKLMLGMLMLGKRGDIDLDNNTYGHERKYLVWLNSAGDFIMLDKVMV